MDSPHEPDLEAKAALLEQVSPFCFLPPARRRNTAARLSRLRFASGDLVLDRGQLSTEVMILARGEIEFLDGNGQVSSRLKSGHYFGERAFLFESGRAVPCRASGEVEVLAAPSGVIAELIEEEPAFAQALAGILRTKQQIFLNYRNFQAGLFELIGRREFLLSQLVPFYRSLAPALHPHLDSVDLDLGALAYVVPRLPDRVTTTFFYFLTTSLPDVYADPDGRFEIVPTPTRRRSTWQVAPGKVVVLLRDAVSDLIDLLTCLCVYAIEARKLRKKLSSSETVCTLRDLATRPDPGREERLLVDAGFTEPQREALRQIWGDQLAARLHALMLHHEDVAIECDTGMGKYNSGSTEHWVRTIRNRARELMDLDDPNLEVHLVSSNTHAVLNCLSPFHRRRRDEILHWGRTQRPALCGNPSPERPWGDRWRCPEDLAYVLSRDLLSCRPDLRAEQDRENRAVGHLRISTTAFTGIEVDLFDLSRIDPSACDPGIGGRRTPRPTLLVNVDFAFGHQAEEILGILLFLFGPRVRSVNVLGKAGGLMGNRGDLLLPSGFLLQSNDESYPIQNSDLSAEDLMAAAPGIPVHVGPVLTVAGTLLQDRILLHYYRRFWKCTGLEMEGSFFARKLQLAAQTGVVRKDVQSRFVYYVSDIPLQTDGNLSRPLDPTVGVPPLYAIARILLRKIFGGSGG